MMQVGHHLIRSHITAANECAEKEKVRKAKLKTKTEELKRANR